MNYTEVPWVLGKDDIKLPSGRTVWAVDGPHIADVMQRNSMLSREECESHARLIAAAPELLATCRDAIPFAIHAIRAAVDVEGFDPEQHVLVVKLRKAINKATKETT